MDPEHPDLQAISSEGVQIVLELRIMVLEEVGRLDGNLNAIIALYLTTSEPSLDMLIKDLLPGVALDRRISSLLKILEANAEMDDYAYLSLLPAVVKARTSSPT